MVSTVFENPIAVIIARAGVLISIRWLVGGPLVMVLPKMIAIQNQINTVR